MSDKNGLGMIVDQNDDSVVVSPHVKDDKISHLICGGEGAFHRAKIWKFSRL
jgi:hypothetical protein